MKRCDVMDSFTEKEKAILKPFFTNLDKPVFVLVNMPDVVKGTLFSRYSRSPKSLRRLLLEEFIQNPDMHFDEIVSMDEKTHFEKFIATKKAEEFYDRVLVGYGDDSVAELAGVHIACEDVSQLLAAKALEDNRIGISPLEKSTRYVWFDQKENGKYKYYRDPDIMSSGFDNLYEETMDFLFDTYSELIPPLTEFIEKKFPKTDDVSDRAYQSATRAKVCDILRQLLPSATLTNVGLFGNGRSFEYLLNKMYISPLAEVRQLAESMQEELDKVIPSFVKRPKNELGKGNQEFMKQTEQAVQDLAKNYKSTRFSKKNYVKLIDYDRDAEVKVISAILYPHTNMSMTELRKKVKRMDRNERKKILFEYGSRRKVRQHRMGRAFENTFYTFDILYPLGAYKDLQRHRMLTQQRQLITTDYGYELPKEIVECRLDKKYKKAMSTAITTFNKIREKMSVQAQYVVPLGFRVRWYFKLNLREICHLTELRSTPQGHEYYRKIAQEMARLVRQKHPDLAEYATKFVDMNQYSLERLESEKRIDKRIEEIKQKYK
ncbi:MAG: FAD-dependent thymidylate synthase [Candidatus Aenigmatarchaeota archaeon]|nr:FAD-dependent thymidylate synthase [Candidatus Aenigmarchaeota archaeon]